MIKEIKKCLKETLENLESKKYEAKCKIFEKSKDEVDEMKYWINNKLESFDQNKDQVLPNMRDILGVHEDSSKTATIVEKLQKDLKKYKKKLKLANQNITEITNNLNKNRKNFEKKLKLANENISEITNNLNEYREKYKKRTNRTNKNIKELTTKLNEYKEKYKKLKSDKKPFDKSTLIEENPSEENKTKITLVEFLGKINKEKFEHMRLIQVINHMCELEFEEFNKKISLENLNFISQINLTNDRKYLFVCMF